MRVGGGDGSRLDWGLGRSWAGFISAFFRFFVSIGGISWGIMGVCDGSRLPKAEKRKRETGDAERTFNTEGTEEDGVSEGEALQGRAGSEADATGTVTRTNVLMGSIAGDGGRAQGARGRARKIIRRIVAGRAGGRLKPRLGGPWAAKKPPVGDPAAQGGLGADVARGRSSKRRCADGRWRAVHCVSNVGACVHRIAFSIRSARYG